MKKGKAVCEVCGGSGVIPGTEMEQLWGEPCPRGCPLNTKLLNGVGRVVTTAILLLLPILGRGLDYNAALERCTKDIEYITVTCGECIAICPEDVFPIPMFRNTPPPSVLDGRDRYESCVRRRKNLRAMCRKCQAHCQQGAI